jgi:predicted ATPase/DNA-binding SARP family transcriptional activator
LKSLNIRLFGEPRIDYGDEVVAERLPERVVSLLAYLLIHAPEAIARARLGPALSPDVTDSEARANLRRQLHLAQRLLPPARVPWFLVTSASVAWNVDAPYRLDVDEFERLSENADSLAAACEIYTADLLPGNEDEWLDPIRTRLKERHAQNLSLLSRRLRDEGKFEEAIRYLDRLLGVDPWNEEAARDLMDVRASLGDRAGAMRFYRDFTRRLQDELGVEPGHDVRASFEALVNGGAGGRGPVEVGPSLPPLPLAMSSFVGRSTEMDAVVSALDRSRLVTVCGPGGVGKSRLALTTTASIAARFRNGAAFIELVALEPGADVAQHLARTLGIAEDPSPAIDRLAMVLRSAALLLVLDNCEHVIESVAQLAYELLRRCPTVSLVTTTRESLAIEGEIVVRLGPLDDGDARQLFLDRAIAANPTVHVTNGAHEAIQRICRRLDNLPLAIELAAARANILTLPQIESRLADSLGFLSMARRSAPNHHRTLRAAIDWSYRLLSAEERELFEALSIFRNGATADAVESVCATSTLPPDRILDHLSLLASKSLVVVSSSSDEARYSFLESIRAFSEERLEGRGSRRTLEERHCDYYRRLIESASNAIAGPSELQAVATIEADYDNVRYALSRSLQQGNAGAVHGMVLRLADYWFINGMLSEARQFLTETVQLSDPCVSLADRAKVHATLARFSRHQGYLAQALALDEASLTMAEQSGDASALGFARVGLAGDAFARGRFDEALALDQLACEAFKACGNEARLALTLQNMGSIQALSGRLDSAADLIEQSISHHRACGDHRGLAYAMFRKGYLSEERVDLNLAEKHYRDSIDLFRTLRDPFSLSNCLHSLALVAATMGDLMSAASALREALTISQAHCLKPLTIDNLERAIQLFSSDFEPAAALELLAACERYREEFGSIRAPRDDENNIATLALLRSRLNMKNATKFFNDGSIIAIEDAVAQTIKVIDLIMTPAETKHNDVTLTKSFATS